MKIERYKSDQRQNSGGFACGCLGVILVGLIGIVVGIFLYFPQISNIVLDIVGIEVLGNTDDILSVPAPTVSVLMDTQAVGDVTLNTGSYSQTLSGSGNGYTIIMGDTLDMMETQMQIAFTEEGLVAQCRTLVTICSVSGEGIRNASFDLRSGGVVINGEFQLPTGQWQRAGLVVRFTGNNMLDIVGLQIGNQVLAPTAAEFSELINEVETRGNLFIQALSARTGISTFVLSDVAIDDNTLTLIMRPS